MGIHVDTLAAWASDSRYVQDLFFLPVRHSASCRRVKASVPQQRIELSVGDNGSGSGEFIDFDALDRREAAAARLRAAVSVS